MSSKRRFRSHAPSPVLSPNPLVSVVLPMRQNEYSGPAVPARSSKPERRPAKAKATVERQRVNAKHRVGRLNRSLESDIIKIEGILLATRKRKRMAKIVALRKAYYCPKDSYPIRTQKLAKHHEAVVRLLIDKISLPLDYIPTAIFKKLPDYSDTFLNDIALKIRTVIQETHDFIMRSENWSEVGENISERNLRLTHLLCSAMDTIVPDIRKLKTLPNSIACCLDLTLFLVEKSHIVQKKRHVARLKEAGVDFRFDSKRIDTMLVQSCHDASKKDAEGNMILDILGILDTLSSAAENSGSDNFVKKSIEQLEVMRSELGCKSDTSEDSEDSGDDSGYLSNESVIHIPAMGRSDASYAPSSAVSDGELSGVEGGPLA